MMLGQKSLFSMVAMRSTLAFMPGQTAALGGDGLDLGPSAGLLVCDPVQQDRAFFISRNRVFEPTRRAVGGGSGSHLEGSS